VKISRSFAALGLAVALALPAGHAGAGPELAIPDFSHLRQKAIDSTDITIDGFLMRIASKFAAKANADDPQAAAGLELLQDIKSVRVRTYTFDTDDAYSTADVESVRKQLTGPGWSSLVHVQKREPKENVDVYVNMEHDKVRGLAVIASEPREFTIVNIVGSIDIDKIGRLEGQFGIPQVSQNP
jgi:hypothetical protein